MEDLAHYGCFGRIFHSRVGPYWLACVAVLARGRATLARRVERLEKEQEVARAIRARRSRGRIRAREVPQPMRTAMTAVFLLTCFSSLNAQDQTGTIAFYRESHFATGDFKPPVFCDDTELARIENGTYFQVTAPAGLHTCTVESLRGPVIEVNVLAGKSTYVHVKLL